MSLTSRSYPHWKFVFLALLVSVNLAPLASPIAHAAVFHVQTNGDATSAVTLSTPGVYLALTLRAAIDAANDEPNFPGPDTIDFDPLPSGQDITPASNDTRKPFAFGPTAFVISSNITIESTSVDPVVIDGQFQRRLFGVMSGASLTLRNLTIRGGRAQGGDGGSILSTATGGGGGAAAGLGGAVFNAGTLTIVRSTLRSNLAKGGNGGNGGDFGIVKGAGGGGVGGKGGDIVNNADGGGGGGVRGPGGNSTQGLGGANENGANANRSTDGTSGGGGGGALGGPGGTDAGSGFALSSGGFGGGGGGCNGSLHAASGGFSGGGGGGGFLADVPGDGGFGGGGGGTAGTSIGSGGYGGGRGGSQGNGLPPGSGGGGGGMGGAIFNRGGTVLMQETTLFDNIALGGNPGNDSAVPAGPGDGLGGAVFTEEGSVTVINCTITQNSAQGGRAYFNQFQQLTRPKSIGRGGGIFNHNGTLQVRNATISRNEILTEDDVHGLQVSPYGGRGIYNLADSAGKTATANLRNTLIGEANTAVEDFTGAEGNGGTNFTSGSGNLIRTQSGFDGTIVATGDPLLASLADNGGSTMTMALARGSVAIDAGNPVTCITPSDQRGQPRPIDGNGDGSAVCDIGSFEGTYAPTITTQASASVAVGGTISDSATIAFGNNPTGTLTFRAYLNNTCTGSPVFASASIPVSGNGTYSSGPFTTTTVGTYNFRIIYSGDSANLAYTAPCLEPNESVTVTPRVVTLSHQATASVVLGGSISKTTTLSGGLSPTGTLTFTAYPDNTCTGSPSFVGAPVTVNGNGSYASGSFVPTAAGTYFYVASYSGDTNNSALTTSCVASNSTVVVTKVSPTLNNQASAPVAVGGTISDTATLAGGVSPTGTLTFTAYTNTNCFGAPVFTSAPVTVSGNGAYPSENFTTTTPGTYNFRVAYSGDGNNNASATPCLASNSSVVVSPASLTVSNQASPNITVGGTISDTATISGGFTPTGTITFTAFTNNTCTGTPAFTSAPISVNGNGAYSSGDFTTTTPGTYNFIAAYSGDANNGPISTACLASNSSVVVSPVSPAVSNQSSPNTSVGGTISDTATISGGLTPTGTITFTAFANNTCTGTPAFTSAPITVNGNGAYSSGNFITTAAGTYNFVAAYSGDANNGPISTACLASNSSVVVSPASPALSNQASPSVTVGGTISDTATISGGFNPTGTITFTAFANNTCTGTPAFTSAPVTVNGNGAYSSGNFTTTAAGTYNFIATYSGDANNAAMTSTCLAESSSVVVAQASPTLSNQASPSVVVGGTISDTATLAAGFNPTGTITFTAFTNNACSGTPVFTSAPVTVSGNSSYFSGAFTASSAGIYNFRASYSGDSNNLPVTTACLASNSSVAVTQAGPTLLVQTSPSVPVGGELNATGILANGVTPTGTITFAVFANDTCTGSPAFTSAPVAVHGDGSYESGAFTLPAPGTYHVVATYSGDENNSPIVTACLAGSASVQVTPAEVTITTQASAPVVVGGTIRDTAMMTSGFNPTGTITFTAFANNTCTGAPAFTSAAVAVNGNGSYPSGDFTTSAAGTYHFRVSYSGDANNAPLTTACLEPNESVVVSKATPSLAAQAVPPAATVNQSIRDQASLTGGYQPTGTFTFQLFAPGDASCRTPLFTSVKSVDGTSASLSDPFVLPATGSYRWTASYSGDANNEAAGPTSCSDPAQTVQAAAAAGASIPTLDPIALLLLVVLMGGVATLFLGRTPMS